MAATFGIALFSDGTYGVVQSVELERSAEIAESRDGNGHINAYNSFNRTENTRIEIVQDSTLTALPTEGAVFAGPNAANFVAETVTETENNTEFKTASIAGRRWINNTVPA